MDAKKFKNSEHRKKFFRKPTEQERQILRQGDVPQEMIRIFPRIFNPKKSFKGPRRFAIISYIMIPLDKRSDPDIEGLIMVRDGVYPTEEEARNAAEEMIRNRDSFNVYQVVEIEESFILSNNPKFSRINTKVDVEKQHGAGAFNTDIDGEKQKEIDETMLKMQDAKEIGEKLIRDEEERKEREQYERVQRMKVEALRMDQPDTLEYYTKLRSKLENMLINIRKIHEKVKDMEILKVSCHKTIDEIRGIDKEYPHYKDQWRLKQEEALREVGMKGMNVSSELITPEEYVQGDFIIPREGMNKNETTPIASYSGDPN